MDAASNPFALVVKAHLTAKKGPGDAAQEPMAYVTSFERFAKEEGMIQGKIEGQQILILHQLKARFGTLPAWVTEKVKAATEDLLGIWSIALLQSDRLEDIFGT